MQIVLKLVIFFYKNMYISFEKSSLLIVISAFDIVNWQLNVIISIYVFMKN